MLTKKTPDTFATNLTIVSFGEPVKLVVVYNNIAPETLDAEAKAANRAFTDDEMLLKVVNSWDAEYELTHAEIAQLQRDRPGLVYAVIQGFFRGRLAALQKN